MRAVPRFVSLLLLTLLVAPPAARADGGWEPVTSEDGITVTRRMAPGRTFPTFRGVGVVESRVWDLMAVLSDVPHYPAWQLNCIEARQLKKVSEFDYTVYSRLHAPWPVSDRDAVYHATVNVNVKRELVVEIRFTAVTHVKAPPVKGVVRLESVQGYFRLTALGPNRTRMEYHADVDPGGLVPTWLAKWTTKRVPLDAIRNMRTRVVATRGWYEERIKRWQAIADDLRRQQERSAAR